MSRSMYACWSTSVAGAYPAMSVRHPAVRRRRYVSAGADAGVESATGAAVGGQSAAASAITRAKRRRIMVQHRETRRVVRCPPRTRSFVARQLTCDNLALRGLAVRARGLASPVRAAAVQAPDQNLFLLVYKLWRHIYSAEDTPTCPSFRPDPKKCERERELRERDRRRAECRGNGI